MQQKQGVSRWSVYMAAMAAFVIGGFIMLMVRDIPVHQQVIEKQLDAKAFLEQKQP